MERITKYTKPHKLIQEALTLHPESFSRIIKKLKDRDLYLLMTELDRACRQITDAVANTTKFEVKPSPKQFQDAEKLRPVIQQMQAELEARLKQNN